MDREALLEKANTLLGCLSHLKTERSYRRHAEDEEKLEMGDRFVSDEARILCSKTFRVLGNKTQVFTAPETPLIRSRKSHVLEVVAVSVITSEMLGLNTNLVRAAALGHDIGHVPFGHQGESWIAKEMGKSFCHEVMGLVVAQKIERKGRGLNLTKHTLEGMLCHSGNMAKAGMSPEASVLRHTDKFAYLFHDANDIFGRMGYPIKKELSNLLNEFGTTQRERTTTAMAGLVVESSEVGKVSFEQSELGQKFQELRGLMYGIYVHVTQQDVEANMRPALDFLRLINVGNPILLLALMTDEDVAKIKSATMKDLQLLRRLSVNEIVPYIQEIGDVDLCNPDLDW